MDTVHFKGFYLFTYLLIYFYIRIIGGSWVDELQAQNIGGYSPSGPTKSVPMLAGGG